MITSPWQMHCIGPSASAGIGGIYFYYLFKGDQEMRKNNLKKLSISVLMMALVAAMAVIGTACAKKEAVKEVASETVAEVVSEVASEVVAETEDGIKEIGEGETEFSLEVVYADGEADYFAVKTDAKDLGTALTEAGIVEGEDSDYGLYIKTVNGVTADYDADQSWWGFYLGEGEDAEMASVGVSDTEVKAGDSFSLRYEK